MPEEVIDQMGDVIGPLPQRRQGEGDDIELEEEVLAKASLGDRAPAGSAVVPAMMRLSKGSGSDAPSGSNRRSSIARRNLDLGLQAQVADLVEEESALIGQPEFPFLIPGRLGEGALEIAEELHLHHLLGHGRAVDLDEPLLLARAELMDETGDQFLSRCRSRRR